MKKTRAEPQVGVDDWGAAMQEQEAATQAQAGEQPGAAGDGPNDVDDKAVRRVRRSGEQRGGAGDGPNEAKAQTFEQLTPNGAPGAPGAMRPDLDMILDIPVQLEVRLGHTKIEIRNLLQLAQGSVVELDGMAGEPMDVLVNGCLIAQGEVVVVNEKFGIRLTDVVTPSERVRKLKR